MPSSINLSEGLKTSLQAPLHIVDILFSIKESAMFRKLSAPVYVQWEVTPECNYNCVHCYNHWREDETAVQPLTEETRRYYLASVTEIIRNGVLAVTVTGGEPLLVLGALLPYLVMLREAGVDIYLNSNLSTLTDSDAAKLKELGIKSVLASLPSGNSETNDLITQRRNSRSRTARGIKRALNAGLNVTVNMVVTKLNLTEIFETACFVKKLGVNTFSATKAAVPGNCQDFSAYRLTPAEFGFMLDELARAKQELGLRIDSLEFYPGCSFGNDTTRRLFGSSRSCTAGKTSCTIGFNGQIRPCSHAPQCYGSVFDGIQQAWDSMEEWRQEAWIPDECQSCNLKKRCGGGCKIEALLVNGSINKPDPYCNFDRIPLRPLASLRPVSQFDSQTPLRFNPKLKLREESFGGLLCIGVRSWVPVSPELFKFATERKGGDVLFEELRSYLGLDHPEATNLIGQLVTKRILQQGE
ncbi:MAG: radical SAM protein [Patescibacteria group bacterium]|jgi:radical SAM protein with 4Fe4S-binding SPASM domain